jgi:hypothetical protein
VCRRRRRESNSVRKRLVAVSYWEVLRQSRSHHHLSYSPSSVAIHRYHLTLHVVVADRLGSRSSLLTGYGLSLCFSASSTVVTSSASLHCCRRDSHSPCSLPSLVFPIGSVVIHPITIPFLPPVFLLSLPLSVPSSSFVFLPLTPSRRRRLSPLSVLLCPSFSPSRLLLPFHHVRPYRCLYTY